MRLPVWGEWLLVLAAFAVSAWMCGFHWRDPALMRGLHLTGLVLALVAMWRDWGFGCRLAAALLTPRVLLHFYLLTAVQFSSSLAIVLVIDAVLLICLLRIQYVCLLRDRAAREAEEDGSFISIVALLPKLPYIDVGVVRRAVETAWGQALPEGDEAGEFVVGEVPLFVIRRDEEVFLVHAHDRPYLDDAEEAAESIPDLRSARAVVEHQAWVSVDVVGADLNDEAELRRLYGDVGRLLAELIDDDCQALLFPQFSELYPWDPEMHLGLKSGDPRGAARAFRPPPLSYVSGDDPRMIAAVDEARRRWDEFLTAFQSADDRSRYAVKAPLSRGERTEFIWITVTACEGDAVYGELANDPLDLPGLQLGDRVTVKVAEINDWVYEDAAGELQGGFTIRVLSDVARERQGFPPEA